jgi:malonate transporter
MISIFDSILPIFLAMIIGKIIKTYWLTSDEFWRGTEKLSYFLLLPCALFNYIVDADLSSREVINVAGILILATGILASALLIYKKRSAVKGPIFTSIFQGSLRYNNYIFFGIGGALYAEAGLRIVAIIALYMIVFTNVISILAFNMYLNNNKNGDYFERLLALLKKFTLNPMIFASILALIFNKFDIQIGVSLKKLLQNMANSALTMGIITVGSGLKFTINADNLRAISITTLNKLIMLPLITFVLLSAFEVTATTKSIAMLYSGLPCATTSYVLSKQLGGDSELMASIITFTTFFSVLTLSFLMYILA